jgi:hypothetical protein
MKQDKEKPILPISLQFSKLSLQNDKTSYFYSLIDNQERKFSNKIIFKKKSTYKNNKTNVGTSPQTIGCKNNPRKSTFLQK